MELEYIDRRNTGCRKWDAIKENFGKDDLLPVWIADIDFAIPKEVQNALIKYAQGGVFGYDKIPEKFYDAFIKWEKERHGLEINRSWISFIPGIVAGLHWAIDLYTDVQDGIMIQPPVYRPFYNSITELNRTPVICELCSNNGVYEIDFESFEKSITENNVKMFILCSPHNPVGRVWTKEELECIIDICERHDVFILADEIHQDIVMSGYRQTPLLKYKRYYRKMITLTAPSKTFNLAGFKFSIALIPDKKNKEMWDDYADKIHVSSGTTLGYVAATKAYENGKNWVGLLNKTVEKNYKILAEELKTSFSNIQISPLEGTYLMWINFKEYIPAENIRKIFVEACHIAPKFGDWFMGRNSEYCVRINLATSEENIREVARRIKTAMESSMII